MKKMKLKNQGASRFVDDSYSDFADAMSPEDKARYIVQLWNKHREDGCLMNGVGYKGCIRNGILVLCHRDQYGKLFRDNMQMELLAA